MGCVQESSCVVSLVLVGKVCMSITAPLGKNLSTLVKGNGTCGRLEPFSLRNMGKKQGDSTWRKVGAEKKGVQGKTRS